MNKNQGGQLCRRTKFMRVHIYEISAFYNKIRIIKTEVYMKRSIGIILALIMLLTLFSCAGKKTGIIDPSDTTAPAENTPPATTESTPPATTEELPPVNDERSLLIRETSGCGYPHGKIFRNPVVTFACDEYDGEYDKSKTVKLANKSYTLNASAAFEYPFNNRIELRYCTEDRKVDAAYDVSGMLTSISSSGIDGYLTELDLPENADDQAIISAVKEIISPYCNISAYDFKVSETLGTDRVRYSYSVEQDGIVFFLVSFLIKDNNKLINFGIAPYASGKVEKTSINTELANELLKVKLEDVYQKEHPGKKVDSFTVVETYSAVYEGVEYIHFGGFDIIFEGEETPYNDNSLGLLVPLSLIKTES